MGEHIGSRVLVGVVLAVVAAIGVTQPGASAESSTQAAPQAYPTLCPAPPEKGSDTQVLPQDPCDPIEPDYDGDGRYDYDDNCVYDYNPGQEDADVDGIGDVCDPTPTGPPTTAPPTTAPPTTAPATTAPPTTTPTSAPTATQGPVTPISGCQNSCAYPREVGLRLKGRTLRGAVSSNASGCESGATVTLWQRKKGADRRLVILSSRSTGSFRTRSPVRPGRYYVTATSPDQPLCGSARSRAVRVGRG